MTPLSRLPFGMRHVWLLTVSSMEQIIGTAVTTVAGVMVPLMVLAAAAVTGGHGTAMSSSLQGVFAASPLFGIAAGSMVIGRLSDRSGYLFYFRLCPMLIMAGALGVVLLHHIIWCTMASMFVCGLGVGGGYSLDSVYISELMPAQQRYVCVGIAKAACALGCIIGAAVSAVVISLSPYPQIWPRLMWIIFAFGGLTLAMRLRWWESPAWLLAKGMRQKAQEAVERFFGPGVSLDPVEPSAATAKQPAAPVAEKRHSGITLAKVVFSGIPWACEGVGVYGIGVFLPMLVSALGLMPDTLEGVARIHRSVELTAWINFFILPGFVIGLLLMRRMWHVRMLTIGFVVCALGLLLLLVAKLQGWPVWVSLAGFFIFEIFLNAGPHLITYVIPTQIYDVADRGTGVGIASLLGKIGAIIGVLIMPVLLHAGGMKEVLIVSAAVMLAGALIGGVLGRKVLPWRQCR